MSRYRRQEVLAQKQHCLGGTFLLCLEKLSLIPGRGKLFTTLFEKAVPALWI